MANLTQEQLEHPMSADRLNAIAKNLERARASLGSTGSIDPLLVASYLATCLNLLGKLSKDEILVEYSRSIESHIWRNPQ